MQQHNHRLLGHCKRLEKQKDVVMAQVQAMQDKWGEAESMRTHLQNEVDIMRKTLEVRSMTLACFMSVAVCQAVEAAAFTLMLSNN